MAAELQLLLVEPRRCRVGCRDRRCLLHARPEDWLLFERADRSVVVELSCVRREGVTADVRHPLELPVMAHWGKEDDREARRDHRTDPPPPTAERIDEDP